MENIFISLSSKDVAWGDWIAYELSQAGYKPIYQHWEFQPGQNFLLLMDEAGRKAKRVLVVLSKNDFESDYTLAELTQALHRDPAGRKGTVIPVLVEKLNIKRRLIAPRSYVDLTKANDCGNRVPAGAVRAPRTSYSGSPACRRLSERRCKVAASR